MNIEQIRQRLELGRPVAAEVTARKPGNRAWVFIHPQIDPVRGVLRHSPHGEAWVERTDPAQSALCGYRITYRELTPAFVDYPADWDHALVASDVQEAASFSALQAALAAWSVAIDQLVLPQHTDAPF